MDLVEIFKALGDETRIRIVNLLRKGELCVCELESILNITQSNASRHLNKLKQTGIIIYEKKAQWVYYKVDEKFIHQNTLLYEFLNEALENRYEEDIKKLAHYKENTYTCEVLSLKRDDSQ
ncbi:transcriptional regulator, ArsR family [Anaerovirgula multivorans]|uniref:Transcriptional regulator, ArsR family n=1 Tax=Anaerovirgula multivorans TaxID=312168 RepID=A0A239AWU3_9FIRM|nr:metalloregulator ArsR/SmtB family transcription factor [Anaerovirgula multivorans]SNR99433.1 transcriptional regulator, ArsR family [Anaerovirgula multivorans]